MKHSIFFIVAFCTLLSSCHRQEVIPLQNDNTPAFKAIVTSSDNETATFDVSDGSTLVIPSSNKEQNVIRVKNVFQRGQDQLLFSINDGYFTSNKTFIDKIQDVGKLNFSTFNPDLYTFNVDTLKSVLGGEDTELYIDDKLLSPGIYTFPNSGIYSFKSIKTVDGQTFSIQNDLYVGFLNPYGYLDFSYNTSNQTLNAKITNTTLPYSISWYLDSNQISSLNELSTQLSAGSGARKLSAKANFNGKLINYECLINLNESAEKIIDIKKYSVLFANPNNAEDLRVVFNLLKDNQNWRINESNTGVFTIQSISFYKEIDGNKIYQLTGFASDLKIENTTTGEIKTVDLKINAGIYLPY